MTRPFLCSLFLTIFSVVLHKIMIETHKLSLLNLPDDMLRVISEYCDLPTRCAVSCTSSTALNSVLLGREALSKEGSERFLQDNQFRMRISRRVVTPARIDDEDYDAQIAILNSVRSVELRTWESEWDSAWVNKLSRIQTFPKLCVMNEQFSDFNALTGLTNLIAVDLATTQISDVSALAGLTNLTALYLESTQFYDVSALEGLAKLCIFW